MGVRRLFPRTLLALAFVCLSVSPLFSADPRLQAAIRAKLAATLNPDQQKTLTPAMTVDQLIGKMDATQRQNGGIQLASLEKQYGDAQGLGELGAVYLKLGAFSDAARVAGVIKEKFPQSGVGFALESKAKSESGDKEGAIAAAQQAALLEPTAQNLSDFKLLRRGGSNQSAQVPLPVAIPSGSTRRGSAIARLLDPNQTERVDHALTSLRRSANGKRILIAIVPESDGQVTEEALREHGVLVKTVEGPQRGRNFGSVSTATFNGQQVFVINVHPTVIDERNDSREVAAYLGGELDRVDQLKKDESTPIILLDWRRRTAQAYLLLDLGVGSNSNSGTVPFSQELRFNERVLQRNVRLDPALGESYNSTNDGLFKTLALSLSSFNFDGVGLLYCLSLGTTPATPLPGFGEKKSSFETSLRNDFQPK